MTDLSSIVADLRDEANGAHPDLSRRLHKLADRIDAASKPLGYLVLSRTEDRLIPGSVHYTAACPITESVLPAERFVEEHAKRRKRYIVAGLLEMPHAR